MYSTQITIRMAPKFKFNASINFDGADVIYFSSHLECFFSFPFNALNYVFHIYRNQACHDEDEDDDAKNLAATLRSRSASLPRHIVPGISLPTMAHDTILFAPKCLVLISRHDYPEVFRNTLGVIYTVYSECMVGAGGEKIKLETLVGNLLGHIYVPRSGGNSGSQVRFTLGKDS